MRVAVIVQSLRTWQDSGADLHQLARRFIGIGKVRDKD
jgi:hypothetical protein